jgi:hypothetical protein
MARITFSIDDGLAKAAEARAKQDRRSLSAHISMLVENDARAAGLSEDEGRRRLMAVAEDIGFEAAIAAVEREARESRKKKRAA